MSDGASSVEIRALVIAVKEIVSAIATLQARVAELESGVLKYSGVYQQSASYPRGTVVSFDGSAWHACRAVTAERPGQSDAWQLMVKRGKDASTPIPRSNTAVAGPRNGGGTANPRPPRSP
jgi:hypothetical protein